MSASAALPVFSWFDEAEPWMRTRNQLAEQKLRPGGPAVARVEWKNGRRVALLFDERAALPKRPPTEAQLAALARAHEKRRTCGDCRTLFGYVLPRDFDCPICRERRCAATALAWLEDHDAVIVDTETTSLDGYVVELAVIDMRGEVLFNERLFPDAPMSVEAERVHGISLESLAGAPRYVDRIEAIAEALSGRHVIAYNANFDGAVLHRERARLPPELQHLTAPRRWLCAMELYAEWVGEPHRDGGYRWQKLPGGDHSALGDARACLEVVHKMAAGLLQGAGAGR